MFHPYKVEWQGTNESFDDRFKYYLDSSFFEHQIHWFSIINSFMMVILLVGFVTLILIRTLKNDFAKVIRYRPSHFSLDYSIRNIFRLFWEKFVLYCIKTQ